MLWRAASRASSEEVKDWVRVDAVGVVVVVVAEGLWLEASGGMRMVVVGVEVVEAVIALVVVVFEVLVVPVLEELLVGGAEREWEGWGMPMDEASLLEDPSRRWIRARVC
jgi:hypothetical protein